MTLVDIKISDAWLAFRTRLGEDVLLRDDIVEMGKEGEAEIYKARFGEGKRERDEVGGGGDLRERIW